MKAILFAVAMMGVATAAETEKLTTEEQLLMTTANLKLENARLAEKNAKSERENAELKWNMSVMQLRAAHKLLEGESWNEAGEIVRKPVAQPIKKAKTK